MCLPSVGPHHTNTIHGRKVRETYLAVISSTESDIVCSKQSWGECLSRLFKVDNFSLLRDP